MPAPPAKRKNMAVTADGAQYNKRHRPDNYTAVMAMPPPPRPTVSKPPTAVKHEEKNPKKAWRVDEEKPVITPPRAQKPNLWSWTKDGPGNDPATRNQSNRGFANGKKLRKAAQAETTSAIKSEMSEVKEEPVGEVKSQDAKDDDGADNGTAEEKNHDNAANPEAPGSPVDAPETHFATFTPMGRGKVLYQKPNGEQNREEPKGKSKKNTNQKDLRYGQASALNLDDSGSDNEEGVEAMRYLKGVRLEANGLPITFRDTEPSDSRAIYSTAVGDTRGFYDDGAYVARPHLIGPVRPSGYAASEAFDEEEDYEDEEQYLEDGFYVRWVDAQEEYYNRLLLRFEGYRNLMAQTPTEDQQKSLDKSRYCTFPNAPKIMRQAVRRWLDVFTDMPPHPVQVAQMDSYCVLKLLDILKRKLECFKDVEESISLWIFALLARLCEVIPIHCDEASIVREMALRALMVRVTFTGEHIAELEDKVPQYYAEDRDFFQHVDADPRQGKKKEEEDGDAALKKALAQKKELLTKKEELKKRVAEMPRMVSKREAFGMSPRASSSSDEEEEESIQEQEKNDKPNPNANTRTTLNMILAVACDVFGQKDLSKYLEVWGEYDYPEPLVEQMEVLAQMEEESDTSLPPMLSPLGSPKR
ncbi:snare complex subunit vam7 protein [Diplodia corticola]|uniref:Snare complex subunit vam7 protein n=1 Tax=Diplodia corticola TaxID=236234 RepID=A0A1J9S1X5_9PEZI|nr:snare complex subunit vam7 protein [Diplodia corticola]OJD34020.1 snare complex subunit vam7 protein [Diplodia corticola]